MVGVRIHQLSRTIDCLVRPNRTCQSHQVIDYLYRPNTGITYIRRTPRGLPKSPVLTSFIYSCYICTGLLALCSLYNTSTQVSLYSYIIYSIPHPSTLLTLISGTGPQAWGLQPSVLHIYVISCLHSHHLCYGTLFSSDHDTPPPPATMKRTITTAATLLLLSTISPSHLTCLLSLIVS